VKLNVEFTLPDGSLRPLRAASSGHRPRTVKGEVLRDTVMSSQRIVGVRLRVLLLATLACLSACSWFASKKTQLPDPTELIVTGAPVGSVVFVDGSQTGQETVLNDHPQVLRVAAGAHKVEIHVGDTVVYREDTYVSLGEKRTVRVLSGLNR
jgi:hypothetical protein